MLSLSASHAPTPTLQRRCLSYTDIASGLLQSGGVHSQNYDGSSDSEGEQHQPIKRSRSDQNLTGLARGRRSSGNSSGGGSSGNAGGQAYGVSQTLQSYGAAHQAGGLGVPGPSYPLPQFSRTQRVPSLPVVLSDVGSSTNSLLSLDSEATRSASTQQLSMLQAGASPPESHSVAVGLLHAPVPHSLLSSAAGGNTAAGSSHRPHGHSPRGVKPQQGLLQQHSSSGFLCSLNPVSSAASLTAGLTHAGLWAGEYDLPRNTSDASLSSGGGSLAVQQLHLPAYSPPPLLSPGPSLGHGLLQGGTGVAVNDTMAVFDSLSGVGSGGFVGAASTTAGAFKAGLSIQQQKQASFQGPTLPTSAQHPNVVMTAALGSSSWGMRQVNSRDSLHSSESITSVEAGERLAGVRFGLHNRPLSGQGVSHSVGHSPSHLQHMSAQTPGLGQLPPLSPPFSGPGAGGSMLAAGLGSKRSTSLGNLGSAGSAAAAAAGLGRPPAAGAAGSTTPAAGAQRWGSSSVSPGLCSEPSESNLSVAAGASPAIELQSMGSILGGDGQCLMGDLSTGAIGALSPVGMALRQPAEDDQQQQQQQQDMQDTAAAVGPAAVQQPVTCVAMAAPVPPSRRFAAAATSSMAAPCSQPAMPGASGTFGFGFGGPAVGAAAAAAAAAAKMCMFEGAPHSRAATAFANGSAHGTAISNGLMSQRAVTAGVQGTPAGPQPFSAAAAAAASGGYARGVSAPLPRLTSTPGRVSMGGMQGLPDGLMRMEGLHQQQQLPYRPSQGEGQWHFSRRGVSLDCGRISLSSRRRGSLELNMPWRKTLDAAIARAAADSGPEANDFSPRSSATDSSGRGGASPSSKDTDADTAVEIAASEAEATFGSGAVAPSWQRTGGASQLDLLMPLPEADDESSPASPCVCGPGSIGPGSMGSGGRASYDADVSEAASSHSGRTSSSGGSIAADHDLPGSTNIGGYIGGSDSLGLARHSLDSPRAAAARLLQQQQQQQQRQDSYGLEFDGAVMLEAVGAAGSPVKSPARASMLQQQHGSSVSSLHSMQQQQLRQPQEQVKLVMSTADESGSTDDDTSDESSDDEAAGDDMQLSCSSLHSQQQQPQQQQQQQQLAGKRSAPEASRKATSPGQVGNLLHAPASALGLDGPMPLDLQSCASASSISSRESPGFYNRRGAGNGASRDLELFVRLARARQTLDFAKRQAQAFAELDKAELTVWQGLDMLDGLREFEAGLLHAAASSGSGGGSGQDDASLTPDMSLKEHAFQVAELCRVSFPDKPWMALVGLLHGLGKLLAHPMWGSQPQWAVAGESFPVGCKFAPQISASEFFSANPDRRRRTYSSAVGVYQEQCGLRNVYMSWGAAEYMYMLLVLNQTQLPEEALFMIRYQRCYALTRPGGAYRQLMTAEDRQLLPTLAAFQGILQYRRMQLPAGALQSQQLYDYYNGLINTYLGEEALFW